MKISEFSGQENGPLAEKDGKNKRTRQRNERGDRKGDYNDSPEIPDGEKIKLKMMSFVSIRWKGNIKFHVPMPGNVEILATLNFMCKHLVTNIKSHVQNNTQESK